MTVLGIESGSSGKWLGPLTTEPTLSYTMFLKNITLPPILKENDHMHCTQWQVSIAVINMRDRSKKHY